MDISMDQLRYDEVAAAEFMRSVRIIAQLPGSDAQANLLGADIEVSMGRCEALASEAVLEGTVRGCAVISQGDALLRVNGMQTFDYTAKIPGLSPKAAIKVCPIVKDYTAVIQGGSVVFDVELLLRVMTITAEEVSAVSEIKDESVHVLSAEIESTINEGVFYSRFSVKEDIELSVRMPEVKRILCTQASAVISEARCEDGEILFEGDIVLRVTYDCEDEYEPVAQVADKIPFSRAVEAPVRAGMEAEVTAIVEESSLQIETNQQGEYRILVCECLVNACASARRQQDVSLIMDAYSAKNELAIVRKEIEYKRCAVQAQANLAARVAVMLPKGMPPMARISAVLAQPYIESITAMDGRALMNMAARVYVIYIASGTGELSSFTQNVSFEMIFDNPDIRSNMELYASSSVEQMVSALVGSSECEVRFGLMVDLTGYESNKVSVLLSAEDTGEARPDGFGICIYIMQPGDTLWSVGRELGVGVEELREVNPDISENPPAGTRLIVYKQIKV